MQSRSMINFILQTESIYGLLACMFVQSWSSPPSICVNNRTFFYIPAQDSTESSSLSIGYAKKTEHTQDHYIRR